MSRLVVSCSLRGVGVLAWATILAGCSDSPDTAVVECGSLRTAVLDIGRLNTPGVTLGSVYRVSSDNTIEHLTTLRTKPFSPEEVSDRLSPRVPFQPVRGSWIVGEGNADAACLGLCCELASEPIREASIGGQVSSLETELTVVTKGAYAGTEADLRAEVSQKVSFVMSGGIRRWFVDPIAWSACDLISLAPLAALTEGDWVAIASEEVTGTLALHAGQRVGSEASVSTLTVSGDIKVELRCEEALELSESGTFNVRFAKFRDGGLAPVRSGDTPPQLVNLVF